MAMQACISETPLIAARQVAQRLVHVMSTRSSEVAAIAVVAGATLLVAFLIDRHNKSKIAHDENPAKTPSQQNRRMTLEESLRDEDLTVKPIGTVRSIYRLCVGTPRQGLLAPHARGRLELDGVSADAVLELDGFSHVWVVFVFHLNTVSKNKRVPAKIAPPALGGRKVGVLATRSPHRMNPIGITLCKLDSITLPTKNSPRTILNVSGLDLVDGTPILDIKPYVSHYDSVPVEQVRLPPWVSDGLATRRPVHIQPKALEELEEILQTNPNALDFYGSRRGDASLDATMKSVTHCIAEVLSIDVRSAWQTNKARDSKFQAERAGRVRDVLPDVTTGEESEQCTQQLDNLLIHYTVKAPEQHLRSNSQGSGAEDVVHVNSIQLLVSSGVKDVPADGTDISAASSSSFTEEEEEESPPNQSIERGAAAENSLCTAPPTDADYKSLKSYWSEAASRNTPTGLLPEDEKNRQSAQKFFVFSAKPVTPVREPSRRQPDTSSSRLGAPVHPMEEAPLEGAERDTPFEPELQSEFPPSARRGAPVHPMTDEPPLVETGGEETSTQSTLLDPAVDEPTSNVAEDADDATGNKETDVSAENS